MISDILVRYVHFISIILLLAAVLGQYFLLRRQMTRRAIVRVQRLDVVYALSVIGVLATGFAQWFLVGKPAAFYSANPIFHTKVTLFLLVGLISIWPSIFLGKQRKGEETDLVEIPKSLIWCVRIELLLLFLMPLLAVLMAKGFGIPAVVQ